MVASTIAADIPEPMELDEYPSAPLCAGLKSLEQTLVTESPDDGEIARRLEEEDRQLVSVVHVEEEGED